MPRFFLLELMRGKHNNNKRGSESFNKCLLKLNDSDPFSAVTLDFPCFLTTIRKVYPVKKLLVAFLVIGVWSASAYADTTISAAEYRVPAGERRVIPIGAALLIVDSLILEKGATLEIAPGVEIFTIKAKKSEFGEGTTISAKGPDGAQGQNGFAGSTLHLYLGEATFLGTTINTTGGAGGKGLAGVSGRAGQRALCPSTPGHNGNPGGIGAAGGNGGKGGDIYVYTSNSKTLPTNLLMQPAGGTKGPGGDGGSGGALGQGTKCGPWPYWYLGSGYNGPQGPSGVSGEDGPKGQATYTELPTNKVLDSIREFVKKHFPKALQNRSLKTLN